MADKLFEQGGDETPELNKRVAWGLNGVPTKNSTWQTIVTWLGTVLPFLKNSENLADVDDKAAALTNLDVYSKSQSDALVDGYAKEDDVLVKNNTTAYTPSSSYNPATLKFVRDEIVDIGAKIAYLASRNSAGDITEIYNDGTVTGSGTSGLDYSLTGSFNSKVILITATNGIDSTRNVNTTYGNGLIVYVFKDSANNTQDASHQIAIYKAT